MNQKKSELEKAIQRVSPSILSSTPAVSTIRSSFYQSKLDILSKKESGEISEEEFQASELEIELLRRLPPQGKEFFQNNHELRNSYLEGKQIEAYVVSLDIRKSTSLMLKAKSDQDFIEFMKGLIDQLGEIIQEEYGIIEKFTGDGLLVFFPTDYAGPHAGEFAIRSSLRCQEFFKEYYELNACKFKSQIVNTGLGIGIDFGLSRLAFLSNVISLVGEPVVYACRLGSGEAGSVLLNQSAFDQISVEISSNFSKIEFEIKNEDSIWVYSVPGSVDVPHPGTPSHLDFSSSN